MAVMLSVIYAVTNKPFMKSVITLSGDESKVT